MHTHTVGVWVDYHEVAEGGEEGGFVNAREVVVCDRQAAEGSVGHRNVAVVVKSGRVATGIKGMAIKRTPTKTTIRRHRDPLRKKRGGRRSEKATQMGRKERESGIPSLVEGRI